MPTSSAASEAQGLVTKRNSPAMSSQAFTKRQRVSANAKGFIPPDVSGLSKREARLVKNRAAAFLSRQRKREEFELMELRVASLEQENARLRDLAERKSSPSAHSDSSLDTAEIEELRAQLAAAREREAELARLLERTNHSEEVKTDIAEQPIRDDLSSRSTTPLRSSEASTPSRSILNNPKSSASLGLMVLLCALPSLLSHPSSCDTRSALQSSQSFMDNIQWDTPVVFPTANDGASIDLDWEFDWTGSGVNMQHGKEVGINMDGDAIWKKLEIEGMDDNRLRELGLGALDISFDTRRTGDGKIRVRVCTPSSAMRDGASMLLDPSDDLLHLSTIPQSAAVNGLKLHPVSHLTSLQDIDLNPLSLSLIDTDPLGPFLGTGPAPSVGTHDLAEDLQFQRAGDNSSRHRVRIALKSLPQSSGECGEWEVEFR